MEPNEEKQDKWQKYQVIFTLIAAALLTVLVGTLAWMTYVRRLQMATIVDMPNLIIQGPLGADTSPIELGDIDVTNGTSRQYMFSITATSASGYQLQLAHTTNIPFTYRIYSATLNGSGPNTITVANHTYSYNRNNPLTGGYLNQDGITQKANKTLHEQTYETYPHVQQNAEPLYWRSESVKVTSDPQRDYYVLDVSWENGLKNNKETDMVYLTVELVEKEETGT